MKIGKVPLISIALLLICITGFAVREFDPSQFTAFSPYMDGALIGVLIVFLLYYANVWAAAWRNNKNEEG